MAGNESGANYNDPYSCDDLLLDAANMGREYGGPVAGAAAVGVTAYGMLTPAAPATEIGTAGLELYGAYGVGHNFGEYSGPAAASHEIGAYGVGEPYAAPLAAEAAAPATASQLGKAGFQIYGAYEAGHHFGEQYAAPLAADLAYVGCLPAEIGSDVGHAIGTGLHHLFHEPPPPPPQPHAWSPDLADGGGSGGAPTAAWAAATPVSTVSSGAGQDAPHTGEWSLSSLFSGLGSEPSGSGGGWLSSLFNSTGNDAHGGSNGGWGQSLFSSAEHDTGSHPNEDWGLGSMFGSTEHSSGPSFATISYSGGHDSGSHGGHDSSSHDAGASSGTDMGASL